MKQISTKLRIEERGRWGLRRENWRREKMELGEGGASEGEGRVK